MGMQDLALVSLFQSLANLTGTKVVLTSGIPVERLDSVLPAELKAEYEKMSKQI